MLEGRNTSVSYNTYRRSGTLVGGNKLVEGNKLVRGNRTWGEGGLAARITSVTTRFYGRTWTLGR